MDVVNDDAKTSSGGSRFWQIRRGGDVGPTMPGAAPMPQFVPIALEAPPVAAGERPELSESLAKPAACIEFHIAGAVVRASPA